MIESGFDVNRENEDGIPPLFFASTFRNTQLARFLLSKGASVNTSANGISILRYAVYQFDFAMTKVLLEAGADMYDLYNPKSVSIFRDLIENLTYKNGILEITDSNAKNLKMMDIFIDFGVDVDVTGGPYRAYSNLFYVADHATRTKMILSGADIHKPWSAYENGSFVAEQFQAATPCAKTMLAVYPDVAQIALNIPSERLSRAGETLQRFVKQLLSGDTREGRKARREIAKIQIGFVRERATEICFALECLRLPALMTLAIIDQACLGAWCVPMYLKWNLITTVKHFVHRHA